MAALPFISAAFSVLGAIQQGNAASNSYKSQADAANYNAQLNDNKARAANQQWSSREDVLRRRRRMELGEQRAGIAQTGLTDTGSVLDLFDQSAVDSEFDILNQRYEGQAQAKGFNDAATLDRYSANVAGANAKAARKASFINAGSALLSSGSKGYFASKSATPGATMKSEGLIR